MSTPGDPPRTEGPSFGPYGEYGGPLQHYGTSPADPRAPINPGPTAPHQPYAPGYRQPIPLPTYLPAPPAFPPAPLQRPAGVGTASTLAVTASLLFVCGLGLLWLVAYSVTSSFDAAQNDQTVIFHMAERFQLQLTQGLAVPLFGFPLLGTLTGFLVLVQRSWSRLVFTAAGVLALGWSAWWLQSSLTWWIPVVVYTGTAGGIVWTRASSRWYAAGDAAAAAAVQQLSGPPR